MIIFDEVDKKGVDAGAPIGDDKGDDASGPDKAPIPDPVVVEVRPTWDQVKTILSDGVGAFATVEALREDLILTIPFGPEKLDNVELLLVPPMNGLFVFCQYGSSQFVVSRYGVMNTVTAKSTSFLPSAMAAVSRYLVEGENIMILSPYLA